MSSLVIFGVETNEVINQKLFLMWMMIAAKAEIKRKGRIYFKSNEIFEMFIIWDNGLYNIRWVTTEETVLFIKKSFHHISTRIDVYKDEIIHE